MNVLSSCFVSKCCYDPKIDTMSFSQLVLVPYKEVTEKKIGKLFCGHSFLKKSCFYHAHIFFMLRNFQKKKKYFHPPGIAVWLHAKKMLPFKKLQVWYAQQK